MAASIFLLFAMAFLMLAIAYVVYEVAFKGLRNVKEMKLKQPIIFAGLYVVFFVVFFILQNT